MNEKNSKFATSPKKYFVVVWRGLSVEKGYQPTTSCAFSTPDDAVNYAFRELRGEAGLSANHKYYEEETTFAPMPKVQLFSVKWHDGESKFVDLLDSPDAWDFAKTVKKALRKEWVENVPADHPDYRPAA